MKEKRYLSKEYTNCLRGLFAILVVVHHLYQYSKLFEGTFIGEILHICGTLSVSMFFFFSGYGLMLSATKKNYIQNFFKNRFLPLYYFYIVLIILYSLWMLLLRRNISPQLIVQSFFFGNTVVTYGWYMQTTFVFYLLYLLIFKIFHSPALQIFMFGTVSFAYFIFCFLADLGNWWYQTIFCMVFGMLYCYKKNKIDVILSKYVWIIFISTSILFAISAMFNRMFPPVSVLYSLFFVCAVISSSYILCDTPIINNSFFSLCGKYSLEIYVTHGLFTSLTDSNIIEDKPIHILTVIVGTVIMSAIMKIVYTKVLDFIPPSK